MTKQKKWAVVVIGARMHYAVPKALLKANKLKRLITDFYYPSSKMIRNFLPRKAKTRYIEELNCKRVCNINFLALIVLALRKGLKDDFYYTQYSHFVNRLYTSIFNLKLPRNCNVYLYCGAALEILRKKSGHNVYVYEQMIATKLTERTIIDTFVSEHPEFNIAKSKPAVSYLKFHERNLEELKLADWIIVPSKFVYNDVTKYVSSNKVKLIPYGYTPQHSVGEVKKCLTKVLTVGEVGMRKGSPIVWEVAKQFPAITFEMVGPIKLHGSILDAKPPNVILHGVVPRDRVSDFYLDCDVFLLPSLCEGSATVIYEALSYGLPILCSYNSGSVVQNHKEGFVLHSFNAQDYTRYLAKLYSDSNLVQILSQNALSTSKRFTEERYTERLSKFLESVSVDEGRL